MSQATNCGDKSSPCKANEQQWPEAAAAVRRNIFVDDFYTSCLSMPHAVTLRVDVTALMSKDGFPMHKWLSSSPDVLSTIPEADRVISNEVLEQGDLPSGRGQAVRRDPQSDSLALACAHLDRPPTQVTNQSWLDCTIHLIGPAHLQFLQRLSCNLHCPEA